MQGGWVAANAALGKSLFYVHLLCISCLHIKPLIKEENSVSKTYSHFFFIIIILLIIDAALMLGYETEDLVQYRNITSDLRHM